ncbi:ESPR domain-containing protein [Chitinimonas koreensis]|uniref:ESPR domain-containing protein n=1 Tax=Chitinimonas koreensis TaxID=356302 RepID=UPI0016549647|nr:ESPR domain-containing protein [Chitinimonas koreensis]QNM96308.1 hypothetical protein H9L41_21335 [Chitinimonas koreensis]
MNKIYSTVWSKAAGALVVASELAKSSGKGRSRGARMLVTASVIGVTLPALAAESACVTAPGQAAATVGTSVQGRCVNVNTSNRRIGPQSDDTAAAAPATTRAGLIRPMAAPPTRSTSPSTAPATAATTPRPAASAPPRSAPMPTPPAKSP